MIVPPPYAVPLNSMRRNLLQRESCSIETKLFTAHKLNATDLTCNKSDQLYIDIGHSHQLHDLIAAAKLGRLVLSSVRMLQTLLNAV